MKMIDKNIFVAIILSGLFFSLTTTNAQSVRERYFGTADKLQKEAKARFAPLLSPTFYNDALDYYNDASEGLDSGDDLSAIQELLSRAENLFRKSIEVSIRAADKFANLIKARNDCLTIRADTLASEIWNDAESTMKDAMEEFEDNQFEDADEYAFEAEKLYRACELDAIKLIVCGPAWEKISEAKKNDAEKYAPLTLKDAEQMIYNAEKDLEEKRYNNKYAQKLADDAYSEALHAMNITEYLKLVEDNDKSKEEIIIFYEEPLKAIAKELGIEPKFENGYVDLLASISSKLEELNESGKKVQRCENELDKIKNQLAELSDQNNSLMQRLSYYETQERKFKEIKNSFRANEAEILKINDKVVLRLKKLQFSTGSSVINPKYFGLLTKVLRAIEKFPGSKVIVAAHTDGSGKSDKNLQISQRRANAVYQYLLANSDIGRDRMSAIGYGESQPIASNETTEGRVKNRRIEIIIEPMKR